MTSIWVQQGERWGLLAPSGFENEDALHRLVEETPELLPLSGSPRLAVIGREVPLGSGYADLLAVEPSGRAVIIEVKLARNSEARRAVVAQILAYAAFLRGLSPEDLEERVLRSQLVAKGCTTIAELVESVDQNGAFDADEFRDGLRDSLAAGKFRLILVLDAAPDELVTVVGYLESIAPELVIDLVTVSSYELDGRRALVPQRVEPERASTRREDPRSTRPATKPSSHRISTEEFGTSIDEAAEADRPSLLRLFAWAQELERAGLARLFAWRGGAGGTTLLPYLVDHEGGLVTIWNHKGGYVQLWRSVFEKRAPSMIPVIEELIDPVRLGSGTWTRDISDELLEALTESYRLTRH